MYIIRIQHCTRRCYTAATTTTATTTKTTTTTTTTTSTTTLQPQPQPHLQLQLYRQVDRQREIERDREKVTKRVRERGRETQSVNHLAVHQFALPSLHHNNSPLLRVSYFWNFRHRLVRYYGICIYRYTLIYIDKIFVNVLPVSPHI